MEDTCTGAACRILSEVGAVKSSGREVAEKDLSAIRWFASDGLVDVSDGHVEGVRCLVAAEDAELRLVR